MHNIYSEARLSEKSGIETGFDVSWYFFDEEGYIAMVASGGGLVPDSVGFDLDELRAIDQYFSSLPKRYEQIHIAQIELDRAAKMKRHQRRHYLKQLYETAGRGIYHFDKLEYKAFFDYSYYLVASPVNPITINDIDSGIVEILSRTKVKWKIPELSMFKVNEIA